MFYSISTGLRLRPTGLPQTGVTSRQSAQEL